MYTIIAATITVIGSICIAFFKIRHLRSVALANTFSAVNGRLSVYRSGIEVSQKELIEMDAVLRNDLHDQAAAIENFRWFIWRRKHRKDYENAWNEYKTIIERGLSQTTFNGLLVGEKPSEDHIQRLENLIHEILSFRKLWK